MSKKKEIERKPDLNEEPDQPAIEEKVKEMLEPDRVESVDSTTPSSDQASTAPELPNGSLKINVKDHSESADDTVDNDKSEADPALTAAIEEANQQLMGETESPESTEAEPETEPETELNPETDSTPAANPPAKTVVDDPETDKAVDDIAASESEQQPTTDDAPSQNTKVEAPATAVVTKPKKKRRFSKKKFFITIFILLLLAGAVGLAYPDTRYTMLNTAGVRSAASLTVLDTSSRQPLKNVTVQMSGQQAMTDDKGVVRFTGLRLGPTKLKIEKRAFSPLVRPITIGWGSNPLGEFSVEPSGSQYTFIVTDYLSGKPISKVEAVSDEASALSDDNGIIKLTMDTRDQNEREVTVQASGYRTEKVNLNLDSKEDIVLKLVPERKHTFVSKRTGKYDVYKVDIDGKNEELALAGTGSEREDMTLLPHPTDEVVALVSTRDNKRNADGFLLSTLTLLNLKDNTNRAVTSSERVQIVDWLGDNLIYVRVASGTSTESPDRHRLMSYNYKEGTEKELARSNYFNDVVVAGGKVYFAPTSNYSNEPVYLHSVNADGANKQTVLDSEVWNIFRLTYDKLTLALQQQWYEHRLGDNAKPGKVNEPANTNSRIYVDSPDGKRSLWVDNRDGKGVLVSYDTVTKQDTTVRTQSGLKNPVRWLSNNVVVFRISTEQETADYALNLDGGDATKIRDVTNTGGNDRWYYY